MRNNNADRVTLTTIGQGVLLLAFAWVMVVLMFMAGAAWGLA